MICFFIARFDYIDFWRFSKGISAKKTTKTWRLEYRNNEETHQRLNREIQNAPSASHPLPVRHSLACPEYLPNGQKGIFPSAEA